MSLKARTGTLSMAQSLNVPVGIGSNMMARVRMDVSRLSSRWDCSKTVLRCVRGANCPVHAIMGDSTQSMTADNDTQNHEHFLDITEDKVTRMVGDDSEIVDSYTSQSEGSIHVYVVVEPQFGITPLSGALYACHEILPLGEQKVKFLYTYDTEGEGQR